MKSKKIIYMDDAIDALEKAKETYIDRRVIIGKMQDILNDLPSAQPEQRWIPCSDRTPKENCRCLTTNKAWGAFEVDWNAWIDGDWLFANERPVAWMPVPEPYKRRQDEQT